MAIPWLPPILLYPAKLRKWEYLEARKCLNCGKRFVAKVWVCQAGPLKGEWIISSTTCSTKCERIMRKKF
ncbi:MAG: hypothetical protein ABIH82_02495 [Candidatus Woesearchaeota archaeon]